MKKILLTMIISTGVFILLSQVSGAQTQFVNPIAIDDVEGLVGSIMRFLQNVIGFLAVLVIVIGGIWYMSSFGNEQAMERAKKIITAGVIGLALVLAAPSFVQEILEILRDNNGATPGSALSVRQILEKILNFALSISGVIAIIATVIGGIMYLTSGGDEERAKKGKNIFVYSVIGIIIVVGSLAIVSQIDRFFQ